MKWEAGLKSRLDLPQVTLCAASSVNVAATIEALECCLKQIKFAACKLFTDEPIRPSHPEIAVVPIDRLNSSRDYAEFVLKNMVDHVGSSHCLIVQWDGYVLDASKWHPQFLNYDYIGAAWPQFDDGHDVGNGGFSLRSQRLMEACRDPAFHFHRLEDVAIGRINRDWLEDRGMCFPSRQMADLFSTERAGNVGTSFGYHGAWLMPTTIGVEEFWKLYRGLDDYGTVQRNFLAILKRIALGRRGWRRAGRLIFDQIANRVSAILNSQRYRRIALRDQRV